MTTEEQQQAEGAEATPPKSSFKQLAASIFGAAYQPSQTTEVDSDEEQDQKREEAQTDRGSSQTDRQEGEEGEEGRDDESRDKPDGGDAADADSAEGETADTGDSDGEELVGSLEELITHLELDREWAEELKVAVKVNGETKQVPIRDVVASYQMREAAEQRLEEAKSRAVAIQQEAVKQQEAINQHFGVAARFLQKATQELFADNKSVNWEQLRADDPAEFAARRADLQERQSRIEAMKQEFATEYQSAIEEQRAKLQQASQSRLATEAQELVKKLPEWKDPAKMQAEQQKLVGYLTKNVGFSQDELAGASDHRIVVLAAKAMRYDEMTKTLDTKGKRIAKQPKVMKPGAAVSDGGVSRAVQTAQSRLKQTGSIEDAFALVQARKKAPRAK